MSEQESGAQVNVGQVVIDGVQQPVTNGIPELLLASPLETSWLISGEFFYSDDEDVSPEDLQETQVQDRSKRLREPREDGSEKRRKNEPNED